MYLLEPCGNCASEKWHSDANLLFLLFFFDSEDILLLYNRFHYVYTISSSHLTMDAIFDGSFSCRDQHNEGQVGKKISYYSIFCFGRKKNKAVVYYHHFFSPPCTHAYARAIKIPNWYRAVIDRQTNIVSI